MILSGEPVGAADALAWGLVDEVAPVDGLDDAVARAISRAISDAQPMRARRDRMVRANAAALPA
jgi:enoyl-CoA hydratase/carnithine racemase